MRSKDLLLSLFRRSIRDLHPTSPFFTESQSIFLLLHDSTDTSQTLIIRSKDSDFPRIGLFKNLSLNSTNSCHRKSFLISLLTHDSAAFIETLEIFLKWQYIAAFITPAKSCRSQYFFNYLFKSIA
jgi:hypothetical protein